MEMFTISILEKNLTNTTRAKPLKFILKLILDNSSEAIALIKKPFISRAVVLTSHRTIGFLLNLCQL